VNAKLLAIVCDMHWPCCPGGKANSMDEASPEMVDGEMSDGPASRERLLMFEVQMYRLREGEYVVDFQVR